MPRMARLDTPGTLHHVMGRGIVRQAIYTNDGDRGDFLDRVGRLAGEKAWAVYAWALIPNHFHLLVRTVGMPLSRSMRRLMTGYAVSFNLRHCRAGHLFQNRFKSIVVEEEGYFLELVRYLHLNPLRAGVVRDMEELDEYPYSGHSALMGRVDREWQDTESVLSRFGSQAGRARSRYREYVEAGRDQGRRPELMGGGLIRSAGGWESVRAMRRGREAFLSDERVLGTGEFVERLVREAETLGETRSRLQRSRVSLPVLLGRVCREMGVSAEAVLGGSRRRDVSRVRAVVAYVWTEHLGRSGRALAQALGVRPVSIWHGARRAGAGRAEWAGKVAGWCK
ncbi:MAG: transposase [Nitrospirae bacterium]|nr:transposase [Nitrospirota bacterium]